MISSIIYNPIPDASLPSASLQWALNDLILVPFWLILFFFHRDLQSLKPKIDKKLALSVI